MRTTLLAKYLYPAHAVGQIFSIVDVAVVELFIKRGPPAPGIKFGIRWEKWRLTAFAHVQTISLLV
jgi:hypothetical protein